MLHIELPDGAVKEYENAVTGFDIAKDISPSLAKSALAIRVNKEVWGLSRTIAMDAKIQIITKKDADVALDLLRHSTAHVLAQAAKELYGKEIQVTIGPTIENGFYYDFSKAEPFAPEDLEELEKRMAEIVDRDLPIKREMWDRQEAIEYFHSIDEKYKAQIIRDLPETETVTLYSHGKEFLDLCRGPHLPSTKAVGKAFKLTHVSGAYWRGDSNNEMLQRVYGTAWFSKDDLNKHLHMLEEAQKRDHRKLAGPAHMNLFMLSPHSPGSVVWLPKGYITYLKLRNYIRHRLHVKKYQEINTPQMAHEGLWEKSGHAEKFRDNMFFTGDADNRMAIKPMSCPAHMLVYNSDVRSYRDLPFKLAEFGSVFRNESSGSLHGAMRLRAFTQDDSHIFCRPDQVKDMIKESVDLIFTSYKDLGFEDVRVKFSDRPDVRAGSDATWDHSEQTLEEALKDLGLEYSVNKGEGAFYGPKLEFVLTDAIGRDWQCGTIQLDFVLPQRFDSRFVTSEGEKEYVVMIHRAIFGSLERFLSIVIEHNAGHFPMWLSPEPIIVCSITDATREYAEHVQETLLKKGVEHTSLDIRNEKISYKVREHSVRKVPVIISVGNREKEKETVSIRYLGSDEQQTMTLEEAAKTFAKQVKMPRYTK